MIFLRHKKYPGNQHGETTAASGEGPMGETAAGLPAILPRSGMGFYLVDLFQLKLICWDNRVLILDHDQVRSETITFLIFYLNRDTGLNQFYF